MNTINTLITNKLLGIPIIIWIAQLLYVLFALTILSILYVTLKNKGASIGSLKNFVVIYAIVVLVVDIIWRQLLKGLMS